MKGQDIFQKNNSKTSVPLLVGLGKKDPGESEMAKAGGVRTANSKQARVKDAAISPIWFLQPQPHVSISALTQPFPRIHLIHYLHLNCFKMSKEIMLIIQTIWLLICCPNAQKYFIWPVLQKKNRMMFQTILFKLS